MQEEAIFAAGCFWSIEARFRKLDGVRDAEVGYIGGTSENPTYDEVCSGKTGHAEACRVVFDPAKISFQKLLDAFWNMHDPTQKNRQGFDVGSQYRSGIYTTTPQQKTQATTSLQAMATQYSQPIATEITEAPRFWAAEEYHQRYIEKKSL